MRAYLYVIVLFLVALPASAQGPGPAGLRQRQASPPMREYSWVLMHAAQETHWKNGMFIGGGVGAGLSLILIAVLGNHGLGDTKHGATPLQVVGTVSIAALIGGLIGSTIPKRE